ncbi:MAG: hypothetical protein CL625_03020 [Arenimonas sp.]|nr:hypothetical protein [Arenimonas sp.]
MSSFRNLVVAGLVAGGVGMAGMAQAVQGRGGTAWEPQPAEVCSAMSVSKHYTLADADFGWVRDQLNATLATVPSDAGSSLPKSVGFHIPPAAAQFGLRLDSARCDQVSGPIDDRVLSAATRGPAKDCRDADCDDPAPGWTAPEGSVMVIWTCVNGVFREVEYKKVDGKWKATSVREERVVSCPLPKDPGDGGGLKPDPDKG